MSAFALSEGLLHAERLRSNLQHPGAGAFVCFEGRVRDHAEGRTVVRLEYEAYAPLARKEGERILAEIVERFGLHGAHCEHRVGSLEVGDLAVWIGVLAPHRAEAFAACRAIIDEVKVRVPIWKKEHYLEGDSGWVNCEHCGEQPAGDVDED